MEPMDTTITLHNVRLEREGDRVKLEAQSYTLYGVRRMLRAPITGQYPANISVATMLDQVRHVAEQAALTENAIRIPLIDHHKQPNPP